MDCADLAECSVSVEVKSLVLGYQASQVLYVIVKLGVPDVLRGGSKSVTELAAATHTHEPSLHRLLRAACAFGICKEDGDRRFELTRLGKLMRSDAPGRLRSLILMYGSENFWGTWGNLLRCVEIGEPGLNYACGSSSIFDYYEQNPEVEKVINAGMAALAVSFADAVLQAGKFHRFRTLVDVGGGHGVLLAAILANNPQVQGILFDLRHVVETSISVVEGAGVSSRCKIIGGDFFQSIPLEGDGYLLSRVIHDWDDNHALDILTRCRVAMKRGATIMLIERALPLIPEESDINRLRFLSDLNMLVRTGGRERTIAEYDALLRAAGFEVTNVIPTNTEVSIIEAV